VLVISKKMSTFDIESELHINLIAPILLTHAFLPRLQTHSSAAIVNVSSVLALVPKQSARRGRGEISAEALANEFWSGFQSNKFGVYVGKAKAAKVRARVFPSIAEFLPRHG
jgi:uncharacterized oxidoreductase